ncbi:MAG: ATP-binding protein [Pseudobdellovibrionaceae bacterium]
MYKRLILDKLKKTKKSVLLLGPRQTGKSTLFREIDVDLKINLASEAEYLRYLRQPDLLEQQISSKRSSPKKILIDEVQRIPSLLNSAQVLIDEKQCQFFLTGSSARKLKRGQANLLPGRIHQYALGPLSYIELGEDFDLEKAMSLGTLPGIWTEVKADAIKTLESYASTYIKEEIQAEALTKNLEGFSRYLFSLASWSGRQIDQSKLSSEASVERTTASRYFEILEDTLLIHRVEPFSFKSHLGGVRRIVKHPKFYFFDQGVLNALLQNFKVDDLRKGLLFEHLIFNQILATAKGLDKISSIRLSSYRTESGAEVDLILEFNNEIFAIELKCSKNAGKSDLRGIQSFSEYVGKKKIKKRIFCLDKKSRLIDDTEVLFWEDGLKEIFSL